MKKIIVALLVGLFLFHSAGVACEGDCVLCHPKLTELKDDLAKEHAVLVTCKTCHTQEEMEKIDMGNGCGDDCWDCHDINKVVKSNVPQHKGLQKCIDCHVSINKNMWGGESVPDISTLPTLDELISQEKESNNTSLKSVAEELNKTVPTVVTQESTEKRTLWESIVDFFATLWQKIVNIFS